MRRPVALAVASFALVTGCSSDDGEPGLGEPGTYPVPGCERVNHRPCDVHDASCRARLMELAACLRGSDSMPVPPFTIVTVDEYVAQANAEILAHPPPDPNHYERALGMLGLVSPGELSPTMLSPEDVSLLGYYRNEEKDIVLVEQPMDEYSLPASQVLVHEFVHALQDRDVDLGAAAQELVTTYDSYLGFASVVEGEARMHETRFEASLLGLDPARIDWTERYQNVVEFGAEYVLGGATPYSDTWGFFPYSLGSRFVNHAWQRSGAPGVRALLESPATHSRPVLASVTDLVTDDAAEPRFTAPEPPAPWTLWGDETLGAWGVAMALSRANRSVAMIDDALDWRGDRLWIYADGGSPEQTTMVWSIEFSSVEAAILAEQLLQRQSPHVALDETRVTVASSTTTDSLDWALVP